MKSYEEIEEALKEVPMTYVPALLAILIKRCATEPIFKGWYGMHTFIQTTYKRK